MPLSLKLPRRNSAAPRPSLRDRLAILKGSAAKVMRRPPAGIVRPKPPGAGTPSKAVAAALAAHEMAYGYALYTEAYGLPDAAERRQAEEEAFRTLLHTPLHSDADRAAYAAAVISRQMHRLGDGSATERDHPMAVAFRNISYGEHAREPEATRHVGRPAKPMPAAAAQAAPDAEDLARLSAEQIDLSRLDVFQLSSLFEAFQVAKFSWEGVVARPYSSENEPVEVKRLTEFGEAAEFEELRAAWITDRIEREIASCKPEDNEQRDEILMVRTQQEFRCNARIHDNALLLDIARAWIV